MTQTTTTLPITITIEVSGTFVPGNLHKVRDEEPQGDTFDDLWIEAIHTGEVQHEEVIKESWTEAFGMDLIKEHHDAIIEALLFEHSKS